MEYSRNFGSNFPNELVPVGTKKDIDDTAKELIIQYYKLIESGKISEANALYAANKTLLEPYMIDMAYVNRLEEETYNIGLGMLKKTEIVISNSEPIDQPENGVWYQEY